MKYAAKKIKFFRNSSAVTAGLMLIIIGLILAGFSLYNTWHNQRAAAGPVKRVLQNSQGNSGIARIDGRPIKIRIPSLDINIPVEPGYYYPQSNSWNLSLNAAQYGVMSAPANNQSGLTFIYGHLRKEVFLKLPKIKSGATAVVKTSNGHEFTYRFKASQIVNPKDTSLFEYQGPPVLTLQTCTGLWYQDRQVFVFDFVEVK